MKIEAPFSETVAASHCSGVFGIRLILVEGHRIVDVGYNRPVKRARPNWTARYLTACGAVAAIALLYRYVIHVNPTTIALTLLLMVLVVSATWGLHVAVSVAVIATLAFNYFSCHRTELLQSATLKTGLPFFVFLVTAVIASELAERARREAQGANERNLRQSDFMGTANCC